MTEVPIEGLQRVLVAVPDWYSKSRLVGFGVTRRWCPRPDSNQHGLAANRF